MSNQYNAKITKKSLKGISQFGNVGFINADNIVAGELTLTNINIAGVFEDGAFDSVKVSNSQLENTVIGVEQPNIAYFTTLQTGNPGGAGYEVSFYGLSIGDYMYWEPNEGKLFVYGGFQVRDCSRLGNIQICENTISSVNANGDINIDPDGFGQVKVNAPILHLADYGDFTSVVTRGKIQLTGADALSLKSSHSDAKVSARDGVTLETGNGDILFSTDSNKTVKTISSIVSGGATTANVTTSIEHSLKAGDSITISNSNSVPSVNGTYSVLSVLNANTVSIEAPLGITVSGSSGTLLKSSSNDIVLGASRRVQVPTDIPLSFGNTTNAISGNTGSMSITTLGDLKVEVPTGKSVLVPANVDLKFWNSSGGSSVIKYDNTYLNVSSSNVKISGDLEVEGTTEIHKVTNVSYDDPILTIGGTAQKTSSDGKDRGIEFLYYDSGKSKLGWFGWKSSTGRFTFIPDATNNSEVISGSIGNYEVNDLFAKNLTLLTAGNLNLACGSLTNVKDIIGCTGTVNIKGTSNVTIEAGSQLNMNVGQSINIPSNIPVFMGNSSIRESSLQNLLISSTKDVIFTTASNGNIVIPSDTTFQLDGTTGGNRYIRGDTTGTVIFSKDDIFLTGSTSGRVIIPSNTRLQLGNSTETIIGSSGRLLISSASSTIINSNSGGILLNSTSGGVSLVSREGDINLNVSNTTGNYATRIPTGVKLIFSNSGTSNAVSAESSGNLILEGTEDRTTIVRNSKEIDLIPSDSVNLRSGVRLNLSTSKSAYMTSSTENALLVTNDHSSGTLTLRSSSISSTSANLDIRSNVANVVSTSNIDVSTGSLKVEGDEVLLNSTNVRMKDPIATLGYGDTDTTRDRGIEFNYKDAGAVDKLGFFGWKRTDDRFVFYPTATNSDEIISGTAGNIEARTLYVKDSIAYENTGGNLNLGCGTLTNVSSVRGCGSTLDINGGGRVNINGTDEVTINSNAGTVLINGDKGIDLLSSSDIFIPYAIPLRFGSTSNAISGETDGTLVIGAGSKIVLNSNVQINGETQNVFSTVTNLRDPIFSIGGVTGAVVDDNKDRGIEFKWHDGTAARTGFFGFDDSTGRFTFIPYGTNVEEVFSGNAGDFQTGNLYSNNLSLEGGNISTTNQTLRLQPASGGTVLLSPSTSLALGNTSVSLSSNSAGSLFINASSGTSITSTTIDLNATSGVLIPQDVQLKFGTAGSSIAYSRTAGELIMSNSSGNIALQPKTIGEYGEGITTGNVSIPTNSSLVFGTYENRIVSNGDKLFIFGNNATQLDSPDITITGNVNIIGALSSSNLQTDTNDYIFPLGTYNTLDITSVKNLIGSGSMVIVKTSTEHKLVVGDELTIRGTNSTPRIDGAYTVATVISPTEFLVNGTALTEEGTFGKIQTILTSNPGKDVGIQVNYHTGQSVGTTSAKFGFFGMKRDTLRWTFIEEGTNDDFVFSGRVGDVEFNKGFIRKLSGFTIEGTVDAGSNAVSGSNFVIDGGSINGTPIGANVAQSGRFTTLTSTIQANITNQTLSGNLNYSTERFTVSSALPSRNPSTATIISFVSVGGVSFAGSGTLGNGTVDGQVKIIIMSSVGANSTFTLNFGVGKLMMPNPLNPSSTPTKIRFKRVGQSVTLVWDNTAAFWVPTGGNGGYVE